MLPFSFFQWFRYFACVPNSQQQQQKDSSTINGEPSPPPSSMKYIGEHILVQFEYSKSIKLMTKNGLCSFSVSLSQLPLYVFTQLAVTQIGQVFLLQRRNVKDK